MTLLINEIVLQSGFKATFQIAAADRRITRAGDYAATRRKLFPIKYLNASIAYFGIASYYKQNREVFLSDWLPDFINNCSRTASSVYDFMTQLRDFLHHDIPQQDLKTRFSGFHMSTYIDQRPDFWYMSNIGSLDGFAYKNPSPTYDMPSSHFLQRDAARFGWDGQNEDLVASGGWLYRNGDFRIHALASDEIDKFMKGIFSFPDFVKPTTKEDYARYVLFKFEILSHIYKKWARKAIVARPIDILILDKEGIREHKP